jgi:hypothetical protein
MQVSVGTIVAKCPHCASTEFDRLLQTSGSGDVMVCVQCRTQITRFELILQIGDEAVRQIREDIASTNKRLDDSTEPPTTASTPTKHKDKRP